MEMKGEYQNFDKIEEQQEQENEEAKTSFGGREQEDDDGDDILLNDESVEYIRDKKKLNYDKRTILRRYFKYNVYNDALSREFLDKLTIENDPTADNEKIVKYKNVEIASIDLSSNTLDKRQSNMQSSGFLRDYESIVQYRINSFSTQVEENTGDDDSNINELIELNVKQKFVSEIQRLEKSKEAGSSAELIELREDFARLQQNKKLETDAGKNILNRQTRIVRLLADLKSNLKYLPIFGGVLASVAALITGIVLTAKGVTYGVSRDIKPKKKSSSKKDQDILNKSLEEAQEISSEILEEAGDNFEVLVTIATIALIIYKRK